MRLYDLMPSVTSLIPYDYSQIKCAEYERIIDALLAKFAQAKGLQILQVSGCPGAGKTTYCRKIAGDRAFLSFDAIMESLPSYQADLRLLGSKEAFAKWEAAARVIGYEALRRAVERKLGIVFEHSGVNPAHLELFANLKKLGYHTRVQVIKCDLATAEKRVEEREKITHRHTPKEIVEQRYALVNDYIAKYQKIADEVSVIG